MHMYLFTKQLLTIKVGGYMEEGIASYEVPKEGKSRGGSMSTRPSYLSGQRHKTNFDFTQAALRFVQRTKQGIIHL